LIAGDASTTSAALRFLEQGKTITVQVQSDSQKGDSSDTISAKVTADTVYCTDSQRVKGRMRWLFPRPTDQVVLTSLAISSACRTDLNKRMVLMIDMQAA
jgi:hypothetical protein